MTTKQITRHLYALNSNFACLLVLFLFVPFSLITAQDVLTPQDTTVRQEQPETGIVLEFIREEVELPKAGSYFNVLRLYNSTSENFSGNLSIEVPESWNLIGSSSMHISLNAGSETLLPIRASMSPGTIGGVSYMINAELSNDEYYDYTAAYISIARTTLWNMYIPVSSVYLSDFKTYGDFEVQLKNRGNAEELIKLAFQTGSLLEFETKLTTDSLLFISLPAFSDTSLYFRVRERGGLSYAERRAAMRSYKASSIYLVASNNDDRSYASFRVYPLESTYDPRRDEMTTPLNIGFNFSNLLSSRIPKMSARAFGKVLFPEDQMVDYNFGFNNMYFDAERMQNIPFSNMFRYMVRYTDRNTDVILGDRLGAGDLHLLTGHGIKGKYDINDKHTIKLNAFRNPFNKNIGAFTGYATKIGNVELNTGLTLETNTVKRIGYYSFHLGTRARILKNHFVKANVISTWNKFGADQYLQSDTSMVGFAFRANYQFDNQKFKLTADWYNSLYSYLRNAGINRITLRSKYKFTNESFLDLHYIRNRFSAMRYPYNFFYPSNININDSGRLVYSMIKGSVVYRGGTEVLNSYRERQNYRSGYTDIYKNFEPGILGSATFRLDGIRSITPSIHIASMFVNYTSENPDFIPYEAKGLFKYKLAFSYYDQAFKLYGYFSSGESTDLYRSIVIDEDPLVNQVFSIRPYYERYFKDESIRLSSYLNFTYYLPSTRENTIFNTTADFFMKNGWNTYLSFFLYRSVRADDEGARIASSDLNFMVGIRKSFDIQQPRLKYYDLKIVGFNDMDGDGVKGTNEKPISNVLINIARDDKKNIKKGTGFMEIGLITDSNGEIFYRDIPEGTYDLSITPLNNLGNLYFLNGENQTVDIEKDKILYLPLVETYKVAGRVIMDRDPNSSEGRISLEGIRITAVSESGDTYSTLTNSHGDFMLSLPKASRYEVSIFNVFGDRFILERSRYSVQFSENRTINIDFKFKEKRRSINMGGEEIFQFNINSGSGVN